jgi:peptidoglycan/LPS O-acetylase OafA/YrhL
MPQASVTHLEPIARSHMPELDSLRGVAILLVLFYHGYFQSYDVTGLHGLAKGFVEATRPGWLGVNLFFVLSGFLITGILIRSKSNNDYYRRFYARRALRILPAYYTLLLLLFLTGLRPRSYLLLSFFYLANLTTLFGVPQAYGILWSLAVEEQFYLLWPAAVRRFSIHALERLVLCTICIVPIFRALAFLLGHKDGLSFYTWLVADGLAMGAWLAIYIRKPQFTRQRLLGISAGALGLAASATFACASLGILTRGRLLGAALQESCGDLAFVGVLGCVLLVGTSRWKQFVQWSVFKFYGDISYGLYLVHILTFSQLNRLLKHLWPGLPTGVGNFRVMTLRFVIGASCATGVAFLSRRYFEEPFLRMKDRFASADIQGPAHSARTVTETRIL